MIADPKWVSRDYEVLDPRPMADSSPSDSGSPITDNIEGIDINETRTGRFGGNDDTDNSGVLRYISIRHDNIVDINETSLVPTMKSTVWSDPWCRGQWNHP